MKYDNPSSAQTAIEEMDKKVIVEGSRPITVELSHGMYFNWLFFFVVMLSSYSWRLYFVGLFELNLSSLFGRNVEQLNMNT